MHRALKRAGTVLLGVLALLVAVHACSRDSAPGDRSRTLHPHDGASDDLGLGGSPAAEAAASDAFNDVAVNVSAPPVPGATWQLVPGSEFTGPECWYFQAAPGTLSFAPLSWEPCGPGCELADVIQDYPVAEASAVAASTTQGVAYARFNFFMKDDVSAKLLSRVVRLSDGATVAALLQDDHGQGSQARCLMGLSQNSARRVLPARTIPPERELVGVAPLSPSAAWRWALPSQPPASFPPSKGDFMTDSAYFVLGAGAVYSLLDTTTSEWTAIEAPSTAWFGGGDGDLAVWTETSSDRVRGWAPDGKGVRTLLETAPTKTELVQPSATRIVGVAVEPNPELALSTSVRFWHMQRAYAAGGQPVVSPVVASQVMVVGAVLRTWGDFAVVTVLDLAPGGGIDYDSIWLLVVNLIAGKAWRVEPAPGYAVQSTTWTLDDTWLYLGEKLPGVNHDQYLRRIRRIRLTELDHAGKATK